MARPSAYPPSADGVREIHDDSFRHSLAVYEDCDTRALRLHAAVWEGELRLCPVWTAFGEFAAAPPLAGPWLAPGWPLTLTPARPPAVTHQSASPTWLRRVSPHRVRLADVQLYVFCRQYRQQNQRRGRAGAFEITFASVEGAWPAGIGPFPGPPPFFFGFFWGFFAPRGTLTLTWPAARRFEDFFYPPQASAQVLADGP